VLTGHGLDAPDQVVLGSATLAALHKHVGDTVVVDTDRRSIIRLRIVGTATLPAIKGSGDSLEMGTGAVMSSTLFPPADLNQQQSAVPGPNAVLIRFRSGLSPSVGRRSLDHVNQVLNGSSDPDGPVGGVVSLLRPAEIANYRSVGATPAALAGVVAAGAVAALALTLVASVRRRRREFALLKAFGFTARQLSATVAWQATTCAAVGVVVGIPLGIVLGRWLWTLFARGISAVPYPTVPVLSTVLVGLGALVFANLVAMLPGRVAAATTTTELLRAD